NPEFGNLWIQGGPRARTFFTDTPEAAPALNKIPLVKWDRGYVYVDSTHMLLPRGLNRVYETGGGERISGCLLHTKFLDTFVAKSAEEVVRQEHYAKGREYKAYAETLTEQG
ncbi:glycosyltransferase family 2 protein, partial [Vibrio sp. 404]|nr:glycosyltransferase family 2 protein [Vibrio marinisediminis]